jgi:predicted dehydrogenase
MNAAVQVAAHALAAGTARLGFVGVGWIGAHRLRAVAESGAGRIVCVADPSAEAACRALREISPWAPAAERDDPERLMRREDLDGVVIATPSSLHAPQALAALGHGLAVFCQKPLSRTRDEAMSVIAAARAHDRLLQVDFCYREVRGVLDMATLVGSGALGEIFGVDLVFHNAYGPDKPWFYEPRQSGGGCVMDLGIHLVDLLLWVLDYPAVERVTSRLYAQGKLLARPHAAAEDYAVAELRLAGGATARLACSWRLSAGCDAVIEATFHGTRGAVSLRNVGGSFYDFTVEHYQGTKRSVLSRPPDEWGGRAICAWARRLATDRRFDASAERLADVSAVIDSIYAA